MEARNTMIWFGGTALSHSLIKKLWIGVLLLALYYFPGSESGNEQLMVPESHECACSGTVLTFNCTTVGFGITLWKGTAFNCQNNQIILLNSLFSSGGTGSSGRCGDNIVARGIKVDGSCHTSQLNVTVLPELNQTSVECTYSSNQGLKTVGGVVITVLLNHYPPPSNLTITNASSEKIMFSWLSMAPLCNSSIRYLITTSDCGVCPQSVANTTATCHDLQPSTVIRECRISVQSVVCGVMGNTSETVLERIGVPNISQLAVVPRFISSNQTLHSLEGFSDSVITVPVNVTSYNVSLLSPSGSIIYSVTILVSCHDPNCAVDVVSLCSSVPSINFTVSAANSFGQGPPSNINTIGCMNEFAEVEYNPISSILSCRLLTNDTSEKSCNISYGICPNTRTESITNSSTSNLITLRLNLSPGMYCFQAKVSNNTFSIIVEGSWIIIARAGTTMPEAAIIAGITSTIGVVLISVSVVTVIAAFICVYRRYNKNHTAASNDEAQKIIAKEESNARKSNSPAEDVAKEESNARKSNSPAEDVAKEESNARKSNSPAEDVAKEESNARKSNSPAEDVVHVNSIRVKLKKVSKKTDDYEIIVINVGDSDTSLRQCVESNNLEFRRDCAFYEFTHDIERILMEKELIFIKDNDQTEFEIFAPGEDRDRREKVGLAGEKLKRPKLSPEKFRLFVQSMGSGKRHISRGSRILYKKYHKDKQPSTMQRPDMSIISWQKQFVIKPVKTTARTLKDTELKASEVFLSNINMPSELKKSVNDVIVVTKQDDKVMSVMTGPSAREMEDCRGPKTTVEHFYLCRCFHESLKLTMKTQIMYQNPEQEDASFHVLKVDKDNVQMLAFIKQEFGDNAFVNGNAFYEFNEMEDLLYYKEVLHVPKNELAVGRQISLKSDISYFYAIPETPGLDVKPPQVEENYRVFLQSTSQGSRCLKANSLLLYRRK